MLDTLNRITRQKSY